MPLTLNQVLPNLASGLANTGFIFGAGTSLEAGYPMMPALTKSVVAELNETERATFDEVLHAASQHYDYSSGTPNIELIADLVMSHAISAGAPRFIALEERLRQLVTNTILAVANPNLDNHIRFLSALKRRAFGRPASVYIFTTNYDVLFELAGARAGVVVETGFVGSVERFFDHQQFNTACGAVQAQNRFAEHPVLTVRLVKLHGSVSWIARDGAVFERHPASISSDDSRIMILPRRRKVMDTLQPPHDTLFTVASRALGKECKYLASCGFSFGDEHINQNLLLPAITQGKIRLFALCAEEAAGMAGVKNAAAFSAGFDGGGITSGVPHGDGTDCWRFSRFVDLFE